MFTTHTPVPAGNEVFDAGLVERNVGAVVARCGFEWQDFAALGRAHEDDEAFGLTPFALRTAAYANGVSALHGEVSRELWHDVWPDCAIENATISLYERSAPSSVMSVPCSVVMTRGTLPPFDAPRICFAR